MTRFRNATGETFRSLHSRNFRLFFVGQLVSQAGTWMEMIAVTWVVLQLTDSGVALGLVAAARFAPPRHSRSATCGTAKSSRKLR